MSHPHRSYQSYQFERAFRRYIAAFDGTSNISEKEFTSRFNNLYHKNFIFLSKDGNEITREQVYEMEARALASGTKVTLIHFRKIGLNCTSVDIKLGLVNGKKENTIRAVITRFGKQAVISKEIDQPSDPVRASEADFWDNADELLKTTFKVIEADCKSSVYKWKVIFAPDKYGRSWK